MDKTNYILTIEDITNLANLGLEVIRKEESDPEGAKGWFCPMEKAVDIHLPAIEYPTDEAQTLYHEFLHAKMNLIYEDWTSGSHYKIDQALENIDENHPIIVLIKELYY